MGPPQLPPTLTHELLRRGYTLAFDPGLLHPAVAVARDARVIHAARVKVPGKLKLLPLGERVREIVKLVGDHALQITGGQPVIATCIERMQIYTREKSKGDPNDLIPLAMMGGAVSFGFGAPTVAPVPRDWIGSIPKSTSGNPWMSARGRIIAGKLSAEEQKLVESSHDALDACGLLLHLHARLGRAFIGSTPSGACP